MAKSRKQQRAAQTATVGPRWGTPTPEAYEGAGMEDLDAALETPKPPTDESIDFSDPDAKAAWLELLTEAKIAGDTEAEKKLVAMLPAASGDGNEPDGEPLS